MPKKTIRKQLKEIEDEAKTKKEKIIVEINPIFEKKNEDIKEDIKKGISFADFMEKIEDVEKNAGIVDFLNISMDNFVNMITVESFSKEQQIRTMITLLITLEDKGFIKIKR